MRWPSSKARWALARASALNPVAKYNSAAQPTSAALRAGLGRPGSGAATSSTSASPASPV
jgi:hypothetical protein